MTDRKDPPSDYEVGYGKPPLHSRFKPGQSGNPKRGPRRSLSFAEEVQKLLAMQVRLNDNGRTPSISTIAAAGLQLRKQALSGDLKAIRAMIELAREYGAAPSTGPADLSGEDERLLAELLASLGTKGPPDAAE